MEREPPSTSKQWFVSSATPEVVQTVGEARLGTGELVGGRQGKAKEVLIDMS